MTTAVIPQISAVAARRYLDALISCNQLSSLAAIKIGAKILQGYRADWGYCCYSIKQLAEYTRTSVRAVCYALRELERLKFIFIDKTHSRNRYTPLVGDLPAPPKRKRVVIDDGDGAAECSRLHSGDVQPSALHSIEEPTSDSSAESESALYEEPRKPIATRERVAVRSSELSTKVKDWRSFREEVVASWRPPRGWDRWAFERSVDAFVTTTRRHSPIWQGIRFASARLRGWLHRERHKTQLAYVYRGLEEWIDPDE